MHKLLHLIQWLPRHLGQTVAWLLVVMVVVQFIIVFARYVFSEGSRAAQDSIIMMHAFIFMLAAAYTLGEDKHVRVDVIYRKLGERGKAWVNMLGVVFLLWPMCGFILWQSQFNVIHSWRQWETFTDSNLPMYLVKTLLWVMPALMALQGLHMFLSNAMVALRPRNKG